MNVQVLIDAIMRQTTVLIAQLATSGGVRAPLAHVANDVFLDLAREIERQGVSRKVSADMFGMALRAYLKKIQRLSESDTARGRSLWEAVFDYLKDRSIVTRRQVVEHFRRDDEALVKSVLFDLCESGLVFRSGSGDGTTFRIVSAEEHRSVPHVDEDGADELVWVIIFREGPLSLETLRARCRLSTTDLERVLGRLLQGQRVERSGDSYLATSFYIPLGQTIGWESAVFDHYQAVVKTVCRRLRGDDSAALMTQPTGSTYSFDVWSGHPLANEVRALVDDFRSRASDLRSRMDAHVASHGLPDEYEQVDVYVGRSGTSVSRERGETLEEDR
jgi:hypothetical protein